MKFHLILRKSANFLTNLCESEMASGIYSAVSLVAKPNIIPWSPALNQIKRVN